MIIKIVASIALTLSTVTYADVFDEYLQRNGVEVLRVSQTEKMKNAGWEVVFTTHGTLHLNRAENMIFNKGEMISLAEDYSLLSESSYAVDDFIKNIPFKIVVPAPNEQAKIQVFTDFTCPACQQLHHRIDDYLNYGITVEFILVARAGDRSPEYMQMSSIFSANDQALALANAMETRYLATATEPSIQMRVHQQAAITLGLVGTPTIYYQGVSIGNNLPRVIAQSIIEVEERQKTKKLPQ
ncbi:thioredoxin fold domain-containing protein [Vibrio crassostreae]|uniref:thioredoxin fold domain-containing protein n=1 Tax=Vibrio crassostreae TaxID=246167 RepID=UPI001B30FB6D|nr:thioredoxin fold domain-containing protein [Vibrio crassostreae]